MSTIRTDSSSKNKKPEKLDRKKVRRLWAGKTPTKELAQQLGVSLQFLHQFARRIGLTKRLHVPRRQPSNIVDPTPEEIIKLTAEIRSRRTALEDERTCQYKPQRVEIRQYAYDNRCGLFSEL